MFRTVQLVILGTYAPVRPVGQATPGLTRMAGPGYIFLYAIWWRKGYQVTESAGGSGLRGGPCWAGS